VSGADKSAEGRAYGVLLPGWLEPFRPAWERRDCSFSRIFEGEPERLRLQMIEGRESSAGAAATNFIPSPQNGVRGGYLLASAESCGLLAELF
jgi:hypothetical protein